MTAFYVSRTAVHNPQARMRMGNNKGQRRRACDPAAITRPGAAPERQARSARTAGAARSRNTGGPQLAAARWRSRPLCAGAGAVRARCHNVAPGSRGRSNRRHGVESPSRLVDVSASVICRPRPYARARERCPLRLNLNTAGDSADTRVAMAAARRARLAVRPPIAGRSSRACRCARRAADRPPTAAGEGSCR